MPITNSPPKFLVDALNAVAAPGRCLCGAKTLEEGHVAVDLTDRHSHSKMSCYTRQVVEPETAMVFCALPWCKREHPARVKSGGRGGLFVIDDRDLYCSDRCREYDVRRGKHEATRIAFLNRLRGAYDPLDGMVLPWALDEMRWAYAQYDREVEPIRLQFLSLRNRVPERRGRGWRGAVAVAAREDDEWRWENEGVEVGGER